jgi:hypothetical protein
LDPPSLVNKLRVLAVRAQVPNTDPNAQSFSDPFPGDAVMLDALVAGLAGDVDGGVTPDQIEYYWFACTPPPGSTSVRDCAGSAALMSGFLPTCKDEPGAAVCLIGAGPSVTYQTASDPVSMASSIYVSAVVATKESGGALGCLSRLSHDQAPGDSCVVALKTLTIQPTGVHFRNQNPAVQTFDMNGSAIAVDPVLKLTLGKSILCQPVFQQAVAEVKDDKETREVLTFSWFATVKDFDHFHSGFVPPPQTPGEDSTNHYTNQSGMPGRVHFWLVMRDDRGGVDWTDGFADFTMP